MPVKWTVTDRELARAGDALLFCETLITTLARIPRYAYLSEPLLYQQLDKLQEKAQAAACLLGDSPLLLLNTEVEDTITRPGALVYRRQSPDPRHPYYRLGWLMRWPNAWYRMPVTPRAYIMTPGMGAFSFSE